MSATNVDIAAERFLRALSERDFAALGEAFAKDARMRGLVPSALRECEGREAIVERFRIWNGDLDEFELVDSDVSPMEDLTRIRWRVKGSDPDDGLSVYEQTAYAAIEGGRIAWMNLVCSGHRTLEE